MDGVIALEGFRLCFAQLLTDSCICYVYCSCYSPLSEAHLLMQSNTKLTLQKLKIFFSVPVILRNASKKRQAHKCVRCNWTCKDRLKVEEELIFMP